MAILFFRQPYMKKILILVIVALLAGAFFYFDLHTYLDFETIKEKQSSFQAYAKENPFTAMGGFLLIYILVAALSLPGATILTLLGGALFGLWKGLLLVSFASTIGATLAFLASRYLFNDMIQSKFGEKLKVINEGVKKEGGFYLFSVRLIPAFPFFLVNLIMGLTPIKTLTFFLVSQVGMLPGTIVYVNAGTQLAQLKSLSGILSPKLIISFVLLGVFPIIAKKVMGFFRDKKIKKGNTA